MAERKTTTAKITLSHGLIKVVELTTLEQSTLALYGSIWQLHCMLFAPARVIGGVSEFNNVLITCFICFIVFQFKILLWVWQHLLGRCLPISKSYVIQFQFWLTPAFFLNDPT